MYLTQTLMDPGTIRSLWFANFLFVKNKSQKRDHHDQLVNLERPIWSNQTLHQCTHPFPSGTKHTFQSGERVLLSETWSGALDYPTPKVPIPLLCKWCCPALGNLMGLFLPDPLFLSSATVSNFHLSPAGQPMEFLFTCAHGPQYHHCHHSAPQRPASWNVLLPSNWTYISNALERSSDFFSFI